jgi:uncharacterized protein (TIGR04551 family)
MWKPLLVAALCAPAAALAQADGGAPSGGTDSDEIRREVDREVAKKVEEAKKEIREEMRAAVATQSAAQGWQEEWVEQNRKLDLFELSGYFRLRPDMFNKFDLNRVPDPNGYTLWPTGPFSPIVSARDRTQTGVNMRLRLEPTLNISEEVRIKMQADVFDNLLFGSTPGYAFVQQERYQYSIMNPGQAPPMAGLNSGVDSFLVKRVWGEVSTPVGILRFGRMGSHWGLGMLHNDGNCADCDNGETVDRVMFVAEPITGYYVSPMIDVNIAGLTTTQTGRETNAPYPVSNSDQTISYVIAAAKRDTDQQAKAKLENGLAVINGGFHFTYRVQHSDAVDFYNNNIACTGNPFSSPQITTANLGCHNEFNSVTQAGQLTGGFTSPQAQLFIPDLWFKYERKAFRLEAEVAGVFGNINNRALSPANINSTTPGATQALSITQFGGVAQGEYRFLDGALHVGLEFGFASGDPAPGMGIYANRQVRDSSGNQITQPGSIDGPQYACPLSGLCTDTSINNFIFARDYRIDNILFRELLGGISDTLYLKPSGSYQIADGFHVFASAVVSRAQYATSTPGYTDPWLGVELNGGLKYETEDGFFAQLTYAILFPLNGLGNFPVNSANAGLDNAQALRGLMGIKF